ncbi:MAG TPA: polyphosphate kinase 1 [Candidatus Scatomorpha gallistercoris]|nr:polyphosphate kinase 1 [Candidatus Scatomorpha gallistercoris]
MSAHIYTQNRELSWLAFNERVLAEAADESVPILERLKFASIFTSNLDEFFMIRVGSLWDLKGIEPERHDSRSNMTPEEQLHAIYAAVRPLYRTREAVCVGLERLLRRYGISRLEWSELTGSEKKFCQRYFRAEVEPIISPQIVDTHHPFPHLKNNVLHIGAWVKYHSRDVFGVIPLPDVLPSVLFLPCDDGLRYIHMEELLLHHTEDIFSNYDVRAKCVFRVTRNADINPEDEAFDMDENEDFRKKMKKALRQRTRLAPVRLELSERIGGSFLDYLKDRLPVTDEQIYFTSAPLRLDYAFSLAGKLPDDKRRSLTYPEFRPCRTAGLRSGESMIKQTARADRLLSFPFESMSPFLNLLKEASDDPNVISIKITIYRLARKAKLVEYLCNAAENGKDVTVFIELRARFDEQNNIDWSERLEDAGCTVFYGFENYKIHSKICLITRRERGEIQYITQVGTGNYNEKTAEQYTDVSLLTADPGIGQDAVEFFKNMSIGELDGEYKHLLVSPYSLKRTVLRLMDEEIAKGPFGRMKFKINSLTDIDIIEKLREASRAGVHIDMVVRGICCILPGIPGETDNIHIVSIVGRFLEHSRIYIFGEGPSEKMYISSADFMTRNTQRRVETACPIYDSAVREKIHSIMDACLADNVKARELHSDGSYSPAPGGAERVDAQQLQMDRALAAAAEPEPEPERAGVITKLLRRIRKS